MEEKKFKQSLVIIAIILGLCGYYLSQRSAYRLKNMESGTNTTPSCIIKNEQHEKALPESFKFEEFGKNK